MSAQKRIREARALLGDAGRAFDADEEREGARLMWEATRAGISAVAEKHGWPHETHDDLQQVIFRLDDDKNSWRRKFGPLKGFHIKFRIANIYREHAETEDDEWDYDGEFRWPKKRLKYRQASIRQLIDRLAEQVGRDHASQ